MAKLLAIIAIMVCGLLMLGACGSATQSSSQVAVEVPPPSKAEASETEPSASPEQLPPSVEEPNAPKADAPVEQPSTKPEETNGDLTYIPTQQLIVSGEDLSITIGQPKGGKTIDAEGYPHPPEGFDIWGGTVTADPVYPGWSGSAPVTILNGTDYARTFHLYLQSPRTFNSYLKDTLTAYERLIKVYDQCLGHTEFYRELEGTYDELTKRAFRLKGTYEYYPPQDYRDVLDMLPEYLLTAIDYNEIVDSTADGVGDEKLREELKSAFMYLRYVYANLNEAYQEYASNNREPFPKEYYSWITIEELQPKAPIGGTKRVSATLSIPYDFPPEMAGHSYEFGILVEDWSQTRFVQLARRMKWQIKFLEQ